MNTELYWKPHNSLICVRVGQIVEIPNHPIPNQNLGIAFNEAGRELFATTKVIPCTPVTVYHPETDDPVIVGYSFMETVGTLMTCAGIEMTNNDPNQQNLTIVELSDFKKSPRFRRPALTIAA